MKLLLSHASAPFGLGFESHDGLEHGERRRSSDVSARPAFAEDPRDFGHFLDLPVLPDQKPLCLLNRDAGTEIGM
jgi:hypothetical protein